MLLKTLIKTFFTGLLGIALSAAAPLHAAGTLPLAMAQQIDVNGQPLAGCLVNFYVAGTVSTPQNAFADFGLTQSLGPILQCDQAGRVPMFWLADGLIHVRLTDSSGGNVPVDVTMQVLGPSSGGGGGGGTVDPTSVLSTGDMKFKYAVGPLSGWVRLNALTIGNATSGATERANADTQALFLYLYATDSSLVVSGGRTGNALNDYNSGKTLKLPDWRGRVPVAMDDMGNTPAGVLTVPFYLNSPLVLGNPGGVQSHLQLLGEVPTGITVSGSNSISVAGSTTVNSTGVNTINSSGTNTINVDSATTQGGAGAKFMQDTGGPVSNVNTGGAFREMSANAIATNVLSVGVNTINVSASPNISVSGTASITSTGANTINAVSNNTGGAPFATITPSRTATFYMKL